jgi:hypothetical protein
MHHLLTLPVIKTLQLMIQATTDSQLSIQATVVLHTIQVIQSQDIKLEVDIMAVIIIIQIPTMVMDRLLEVPAYHQTLIFITTIMEVPEVVVLVDRIS